MHQEHLGTCEAIGIPIGFSPRQLLYIVGAQILIAEVYLRESPTLEHRLFARRLAESRYTVIGSPGEGIQHRQAVALPDAGCAYFAVWSTQARTGPVKVSSNWESIQRLHLDDYRIEPVVAEGELVVPAPYDSAWISDLLSVAPDGASLVCKCGLERRSSETTRHVDYFLCYLGLSDKRVTPLTKLDGVWF